MQFALSSLTVPVAEEFWFRAWLVQMAAPHADVRPLSEDDVKVGHQLGYMC